MASVTINFTSNNVTYRNNDSLIVSFNGPFASVVNFTSYNEATTPEQTGNDYLITNLRWSLDQQTWSSWILLSKNADGSKNLPNLDFPEGSNVYIEFKFIRISNPEPPTPLNLSIDSITLDFDISVPESDYNPPTSSICPTGDYYRGIKIDCEDGQLFRVYDLMQPAIQLNRELALAASEMFGHQVCYFKTSADERTKDYILKEYSLYNVSDVKNIRVMVPDNQFPDNKIVFAPFDMNFEEGFEIHIVKEDFERAFGYCVRPDERDYLYFPLENRLYDVESPYLFKDFMRDGVYYKLNLTKYQDSANVLVEPGSTADNIATELIQSFDEIFEEENQKEYNQITKPLQYNTFNVGSYDFVRSQINQKLEINKHDINNYFTIVAKYAYDLNSVDYNDLGVLYKNQVNVSETDDRVYMFWFRMNRQIFENTELGPTLINVDDDGNKYDTLFKGSLDDNGIDINMRYAEKNGSYETSAVEVKVNGESFVFDETYLQPWPDKTFPNLLVDAKQYNQRQLIDSRKWFAMVVNVSNQYQTINCNIWEMQFDASKPAYIQQTTQLRLIFGQTHEFQKREIKPNTNYSLNGAPIEITNIRILNELINEENQPLMLNRYTVRDNQYAIMIDNALPPLALTREPVR